MMDYDKTTLQAQKVMRTKINLVELSLLSVALLAGCAKEPPKCSDENTLDLVRGIISDKISAEIGLAPQDVKKGLKFDFPKATSFDEKIKKYSCDATLVTSETYKVPVEYESQLDDKDDHIVSLKGMLPGDLLQIKLALVNGTKANQAQNETRGTPEQTKPAVNPALAALLGQVYGSYLDKNKCWVTFDKENDQKYCMKIDKVDNVSAGNQQRIYAILSGNAIDDEGGEESAHVLSGMVGAFVIEDRGGQLSIISSSPQIPMGSSGSAPGGWGLVKIGNDNYYGWNNSAGDCHQGYCGNYYVLLAPYGKKVKNLAGIASEYSDVGSCSDEPCKSTSLEAKLEFDATNTTGKVFPLVATVSGSDAGKTIEQRKWIIPFNEQKWEYTPPKDYILNDRDF